MPAQTLQTAAIRIHQTGDPSVLCVETIAVPPPAAGEVRIIQEAIGLNFIDIYHRTGLYPLPLPSVLGQEGAGIIEAIGDNVEGFKVGDRVAYAIGPLGAYAKVRNFPAERLLKLPEHIDFKTAAAMMLQGLTAAYLLRKTYRVQKGDRVLIHAAAGGVGLMLVQWAKALGATVIGTVSSEEKALIAKAHGADHIIFYTHEEVAKKVRELTQGEGVAVVYDGVGKDTFMASLDSLKVRGTLASFGNASGAVEPFSPLLLAQKGSLFLTRGTLLHHIAERAEMLELSDELFTLVQQGQLKIAVNQSYALSDAAKAHQDLAARKTTGSTILLP